MVGVTDEVNETVGEGEAVPTTGDAEGDLEGEGEGVAATMQVVVVHRPDEFEQPSETFTVVNGEPEHAEVP